MKCYTLLISTVSGGVDDDVSLVVGTAIPLILITACMLVISCGMVVVVISRRLKRDYNQGLGYLFEFGECFNNTNLSFSTIPFEEP